MKGIDYHYTTEFRFPFAVKEFGDEERIYDVDSFTSFRIRNNAEESGKGRDCTFRLYAKCSVDAESIEGYNPTDYEQYAWDLRHFYNIVRLGIAYLTGVVISSQSNARTGSSISDFSNLLDIKHDFYERATDAGVSFPVRKGRMCFTSGAYIADQLTIEKLSLLQKLAKAVRTDSTGAKMQVLDLYFRGFIDSVHPYYHWFQIFEVVVSRGSLYSGRAPSQITLGTEVVELDFLRYYAHVHRHHADADGAKRAETKLNSDPRLAPYLNDPQGGRKFYEDNLRVLIEHFLFHC